MENFKVDFEKTLRGSNLSEKETTFKNFNAKEFLNQGFPNRKHEDWKFSDINQIINKEIGELKFYREKSEKSGIDKDILLNHIEHNKLVFVNGQLEKIDFNSEDKSKILNFHLNFQRQIHVNILHYLRKFLTQALH